MPIFFPAFTIGLASYLAALDFLWLKMRGDACIEVLDYCRAIFAVTFGMGMVSGIITAYQFRINWPVISDKAER